MDLNLVLNLAPYFAAMLISLGTAVYAWRRRVIPTAATFSIYAFAQASMILGYIFELLGPTLAVKVFWDNFQWIGALISPIAMLIFSFQHIGQQPSYMRRLKQVAWLVGLVFLLLVYTDSWHHLIRPTAWLVPGDPFNSLMYDFSPITWVLFIYIYVLLGWTLTLMIRSLASPHPFYRAQTIPILVGMALPILGSFLTIVGINLTFQRDTTPFTFTLGNLIIAWGIFRYGVFDILPIARDTVIEKMEDGVVVLDNKQRIIDVNPTAQQLARQPAARILGHIVTAVFPNWPTRFLAPDFQDDHPIELSSNETPNTQYLELRRAVLYDRFGRFTGQAIVIRDITNRKRVEQELHAHSEALERVNGELEAANIHLQTLDQVKDQFVANVSHELRTPIANLKLHLELLNLKRDNFDKYMPVLYRETERLSALIESLLFLSRLDKERVALQRIPVNLNNLVCDYCADRAALAKEHQLTLTAQTTENLPYALADPNLIGQVLSILLTNSFNYTPAEGSVIVGTQMCQETTSSWIGFSVSDTGPGISATDQVHIFKRFFRGDAARDSGKAGTGLGLAIAYEIVQQYNGRIELHSEGVPGQGATFSVWLPTNDKVYNNQANIA